jgi:ketosteroid isomerase-like protein
MTKRTLGRIITICCIAAASVAGIRAGEPDAKADTLNTAEAQMWEAFRLHDVAALDRLLADDYLTVNADGSFWDKPQTLAFNVKGGLNIQSVSLEDRQVRLYGDVGVITGRTLINASVRIRYTEVWVRSGDRWRFASWQGTEVH